MNDKSTSAASTTQPRWWLIGLVLFTAHLGTAAWYYWSQSPDAFRCPYTRMEFANLNHEASLDEWEKTLAGADTASYLNVARNWAAGNGVNALNRQNNPPTLDPFIFWGPGTPLTYGIWYKLTGWETYTSAYTLNVLMQIAFGWITVLTVGLYTRRTWPLVLTAIFTGFCPPLSAYFSSIYAWNSETASLVPLSLMYYFLSRGFIAFRTPTSSAREYVKWFIGAGLALGIGSISRDSLAQFGTFVALFFVAGALWQRTKLSWRRAAFAALSLYVATTVARLPVEAWNKYRVHHWCVSSSSKTAIWLGLWSKHDAAAWIETCGLGFGEYLDPEAAQRVQQSFANNESLAKAYSAWELVKAIATHPLKALEFKAARLPVLLIGTAEWPNMQWTSIAYWSMGAYVLLGVYLVACWRWKQRVPEMLYLYLLFLGCALPLIHFEFRYSFPVWHGLVMVPGLLWDLVARRYGAGSTWHQRKESAKLGTVPTSVAGNRLVQEQV